MEGDKDLACLDQRLPDAWVAEGMEHQKRHPPDCSLHLALRSCASHPLISFCGLCEHQYEDPRYR
jgi:hypothetical protein